MNLQATFRQNNVNEIKAGEQTLNSLEIAEMVGKDHNNVMKDIRRIIEQLGEVTFYQSYFIESTYINSQNKQQPCFKLTKKGCELYSTRMTGSKGTQFAVAYIERFNQMEQKLTQPVTLTPREQMNLIMQVTEDAHERIDFLVEEVKGMKESIYIDRRESALLNRKAKCKVISSLGGQNSKVYKELSRKGFGGLWGEFNRYFDISSYKDLKKVEMEIALQFIESWRPNTALQMEINAVQSKIGLFD